MLLTFATALAGPLPLPPSTEPVVVPLEPRPEVDFVLIWADAKLMRAADGGGSVQVAPDAPRVPGNWLLARVIDHNVPAGVVHVGLAPHSNLAEHCVASPLTSAPVDLEVWVFEADLQRVVTAEFTGGEDLTVRPGAPVVEGRAWMWPLHTPAPLPEGALTGLVYRPDARAMARAESPGWASPGAEGMLGELSVAIQKPVNGPAQVLLSAYDAETKRGTFSGGCGTAHVTLSVPPHTDGFATSGSTRPRGGRPHYYASSGTEVVWEDGTRAGSLPRKRGWSDGLSKGPLRCWDEPVGSAVGATRSWRLCVATDAIVER